MSTFKKGTEHGWAEHVSEPSLSTLELHYPEKRLDDTMD